MEIIDKKTNGGKAYVFLNNLNGEPLTQNTAWIICPTCGGKTRDRIREDYSYSYQRARHKDAEPMNVRNHSSSALFVWYVRSYFPEAVPIKALAVALTTSRERSSQL